MRRIPYLALLAVLVAGVGFVGASAHADAIDDEPVPGLEPARRAPPMAPMPPVVDPQPEPEPIVVADSMDDEPDPGLERSRRAEPTPAAHGDAGWRFMLEPYLWLPSIKGTSTIDGFSADVDATFNDIIDSFDVFGLSGRAEAHKERFGLFLDVLWIDLDGDFGSASAPGFRVEPDIEEIKVDFGLMYEAARWETSQGSIAISPLVGGRFTWLKQRVKLRGSAQARTLGERETWWEPFVGARIAWQVSKPFDITVQGDVGGFGVGSDLTWQVAGMFGFRFTDWFKLNLGYAVYEVDWSTGSGRGKQGFDVTEHGPRIGLQFDL
jgi:hypothetical protein